MTESDLIEQESKEPGSADTSGLGQLLRTEREKKGISYAQISEKTRLSPHILKALENEDWQHLPAPFYVRSFIRSYAHLLGIKQAEAIKLYQEAVPAETSTPEPVERPDKSRKKLYLFYAAILIAVAFALYLWKGYSSHHKTVSNSDRFDVPEEHTQAVPRQGSKILDDQTETPAPSIIDKMPEKLSTAEDIASEEAEGPPSIAFAPTPESRSVRVPETPELTLELDAREKTWVRIFVDDQQPKEYMFRPGDHLEWKAKKGFDMLIGNAGGIELEFNNTEIRDLGSHGEVVRLRLPEGYERGVLQDED
jgi:cytoskeleton protein RodZ